LLVLGGGITALVLRQRRKARPTDDLRVDPVQTIGIDDAELADLDVDAHDRDAALDLAALELEPLTRDRDHGSLFDAHLPIVEAELVDDDDAAYSRGQNWVERLETKSIEDGGEPGRELVIEDDYDVDVTTSPRIDTSDLPVADRGSAGPRGI
jgi:hypothetical protein